MHVKFDDLVATIKMDEGKANAIDPRFVKALRSAVREVHEGGARSVILVGSGTSFSSGLNLPAVSALARPALESFVRDFMEMLLDVLSAPMPFVAAMNGHAVAGGCILALACDYRVMAHGDYRVGLNEIDLGIRFPSAALQVAMVSLPRPVWTEMLLRGRFTDPEDALGMGIVHQLADPVLLLQSALAVAREFASKPPQAMKLLRRDLNGEVVRRVRAHLDEAVTEFADAWFSAEAQELVRDMCEQLTVRR